MLVIAARNNATHRCISGEPVRTLSPKDRMLVLQKQDDQLIVKIQMAGQTLVLSTPSRIASRNKYVGT